MYSAVNLVAISDLPGTWVLEAIDVEDGGIERAEFSGYRALENAQQTAHALYPTMRISLDRPL